MTFNITLEDAQEMHRLHPQTFWAPDEKELAALVPGSTVKICDTKERFWVEIETIEGDTCIGRIDNDLVCGQPYNYGDTVEFKKQNIYQIYEE